MKNKNGMFLIIVLGFLLIVSAVTKPDENDFNKWVKDNYSEVKKSDNTSLLEKGATALNHYQLSKNLVYEDKLIFAVAKTSSFGKDMRFIGVFGTWFSLGNV